MNTNAIVLDLRVQGGRINLEELGSTNLGTTSGLERSSDERDLKAPNLFVEVELGFQRRQLITLEIVNCCLQRNHEGTESCNLAAQGTVLEWK